jgi:hypothetical protein
MGPTRAPARSPTLGKFAAAIATPILAAMLLAPPNAAASDAPAPSATPGDNFVMRGLRAIDREGQRVWDQGTAGLYFPLYTRHCRGSYTPEKIATFNEFTWGLGYHRTLRDEDGNYRALFAMGLNDSHRDLQLQAGYSYERVWYRMGPLELRAGFTALIFQRADIYNGIPFPGVLPLFGAGTRNFDLKLTHIPRISKNLNNGDVTFMMVSYTF